MANLLPCPFCGTMPKINTTSWSHYEDQTDPLEVVEQRVIITCPKCFCKKDVVNTAYMLPGQEEEAYRKCAKYLAAETIRLVWNRRTNDV